MTLPKEVLERIRFQAKSYQEDPSFEVGYETGAIREAMRAEKFKEVLEEIAKGRQMGGAEGYLGGLAMKVIEANK